MRSEGTSWRFGEGGTAERVRRACPRAGAERDETRARLCVSALRAATTARPTSPQPPRSLPTAPTTGTTRRAASGRRVRDRVLRPWLLTISQRANLRLLGRCVG